MPRNNLSKTQLFIALAGSLLIAPFAVYTLFCIAYSERFTLYKRYAILTDIGRCGFEIKVASGVLYAAMWVLTGFLLRKKKADEN